ncbi:MAG: CoA pyrophosphatase [Pseudomonadota bacterium]
MPRADLIARLQDALTDPAGPSSDFDLNPEFRPLENRELRPAAVLIAVRHAQRGPEVVLTRRSAHLRHHPGQIAFPGGKVDAGDADAVAAATREAWEEIGLPPSALRQMGTLPAHETTTGFTITPVVAEVTASVEWRPEAGEVDEVFQAPLTHVLDRDRFVIKTRLWRGRRHRYYAVPYGRYYIWGATARILRALAERVA